MNTRVSQWAVRAAGIAAVMGVALAAPAQARYEGTPAEHLFSIGGRAAYFDPKASQGNNVWFGGAQLRMYLSPALAIEGSIDYRNQNFGDVKVQTYPVQASVLLYLLDRQPLAFFVLGGAGWYNTHVDVPQGNDSTDNRFGPHAGGGVQLFFNDRVSMDVTARYIWLEKLHQNDPNILERSYDDSGVMYTAGLNYHF